MFKKVDHIEIVPGNMDRSIDFYTAILGFRVKSRHKIEGPAASPVSEVAYIELNGTLVELISMKKPSPASGDLSAIGYRMMAIEVENMDKAIAFLKSKGVVVSQEPRPLGESKRAEIKDPDGISIELRQW